MKLDTLKLLKLLKLDLSVETRHAKPVEATFTKPVETTHAKPDKQHTYKPVETLFDKPFESTVHSPNLLKLTTLNTLKLPVDRWWLVAGGGSGGVDQSERPDHTHPSQAGHHSQHQGTRHPRRAQHVEPPHQGGLSLTTPSYTSPTTSTTR